MALSKVDQLEEDQLQAVRERFTQKYPDRPVYCISALGDIGLQELVRDLMQALTEEKLRLAEDEAFAHYSSALQDRISADVFAHSQKMRAQRRAARGDDDDDWDDGDVEVVYVNE